MRLSPHPFCWLASACLLGCASTAQPPADAPPAPPAPLTEEAAPTALIYEDLERYEEMIPQQLDWSVGPADTIEVRWLSGPEAIAAIEARENLPDLDTGWFGSTSTLKDLLQHPDARVLHMVARGAPLPDIEQFYIPMPSEGPARLKDLTDKGPGLIFMSHSYWVRSDAPRVEGEDSLERWPRLDEASLGALLESGESFVIFQHMTTCGGASIGRRHLNGLDLPDDFPLYVDDDFQALQAHFDDQRMRLPSSSFLAFHEGEWVDFHPATSMSLETIEHFFHRIGLMDDGPQAPMISPAHFGEDANMALALTHTNYWTSLAMQDVDLQGMRMWHGAISGSDFSGADLSGAIFKDVLIARTSFKGAFLEGATFENVTLNEVVCVDGQVRSGEARGCLLASE